LAKGELRKKERASKKKKRRKKKEKKKKKKKITLFRVMGTHREDIENMGG
jgi:hydrogenase maturation factor